MAFLRRILPLLFLLGLIGSLAWTLPLGQIPPADYTIANGTDPKSLDPALASGTPEGRVLWALFEGLTSLNPQTLHPEPGMAERWEISPDQKTYTFFLRENAVWSDGTPITATDFAWSMLRMLHPATAAEYSYELWYIVNAKAFTTQSVKPGDTVEIEIAADELTAPERQRYPVAPLNPQAHIMTGKLLATEVPATKPQTTQSATSTSSTDTSSTTKTDQETPVESPDLVYIVEINGIPRRFQKEGLDGGKKYLWLLPSFQEVGIQVLDPRTLRITLEHPVPYFLDLMAFYPFAPVQRACVERHGSDWTKPGKMVSNGPYVLQRRGFRERIRVVKNPLYWDREKVKLNVVDFLCVQSIVTGVNLYLTGQVDWIEVVPTPMIPALLARQHPDFQPQPYITTTFYRLNVTQPPLSNKKFRQALNAAIDKQALVDKIVQAGDPARNVVSPVITSHRPAYCGPYDPRQAKELLAEALAELSGELKKPQTAADCSLMLQFNTNEKHQAVAEFLQDQWQRHLGIRVQVQGLEWGSFQSNMKQLNYQVSRYGWVADYPDPSTFLGMFITGGGNNQTGWSNAKFDELVSQAQEQTDPARRAELWHQAEEILMDELPALPLFFDRSTSLTPSYVKGYSHNYHNVHPLKGMWIDQAEKAKVLGARRP
ncbi:MAG: peptide ABC transporter substrate-binding protein [Pirellulales bacterium]|nr:peptide ABC transporter substrate-binding protein [Pirellulales bacterium]